MKLESYIIKRHQNSKTVTCIFITVKTSNLAFDSLILWP